MTPIVSILILNYRSPQQTVRCVQSFLRQTIAADCEVIVIDNHSDDDSYGVFQHQLRHPSVRIVEASRNRGFGSGYNLGARYARGRYLLINNPDKIFLEQGGLERLVDTLRADSSIGIIAGKLMHEDGTRRLSVRAFPRMMDLVAKRTVLQRFFAGHVRRYLRLDLDPDRTQSVDWVIGGAFLIEREFFWQMQGFDERYFLFFEDIDLCRRCHGYGRRVVYFPAVTLRDRRRRLSEMSAPRMLWSRIGRAHLLSALRYFWKWRVASLPVTLDRI